MMILSHWYDLSNVGTEELVKKSLSCMRFFGFRLEDQIPDHTTLCGVRNEIVTKKAYELLLKKINKELEKHQAMVKTEVIVSASITVRPLVPNGGPTYVGEDRKKEAKANQSKKEKVKKKTIRSRNSRKMAQEIR
ncbi:MAG: transposase [Flavobacteriales bacterium Tduv]